MCDDWTDIYDIYSGTVTNSVAPTTDVDLQGVHSGHVLEVAVTSFGGQQVVDFQGSLDGVNYYDIYANPQVISGAGSVAYVSTVPARHIRVILYTLSGTNTVNVTGASK